MLHVGFSGEQKLRWNSECKNFLLESNPCDREMEEAGLSREVMIKTWHCLSQPSRVFQRKLPTGGGPRCVERAKPLCLSYWLGPPQEEPDLFYCWLAQSLTSVFSEESLTAA